MRHVFFIGIVVILMGCGESQHKDLKSELTRLSAGVQGNVATLPPIPRYDTVPYQATTLADPFSPAKIELVVSAVTDRSRTNPDFHPLKEPLEAFPLETLSMIGAITRKEHIYALVRADGSVYRVKVGDFLRQNLGRITGITEDRVDIHEWVLDSTGQWKERMSSLQLQQAAGGR